MKIIKDNIWNYLGKHPICIPTNGYVKRNGAAVMGAGLAKQVMEKFPGIEYELAAQITRRGHVFSCISNSVNLYSFPVKPVDLKVETPDDVDKLLDRFTFNKDFTDLFGKIFAGWMCKADINIITKSAEQLCHHIDGGVDDVFVLPKVGCGNGELHWEYVKYYLEPIFDCYAENIIVVDFV